MRLKNGDFMDSMGILSGKPRSADPYTSWSPAHYRGIKGFILIFGEKSKHIYICLIRSLVKSFSTDQKNPLIPKNPATPRLAIAVSNGAQQRKQTQPSYSEQENSNDNCK